VIDELLSRARQRVFLQSFSEAVVTAAAICFAVGALVLVTGTGLLAIWIPAAAGLLMLGWASFRAIRNRPTALRAARTLDQRCGLSDALATELHFRESELDAARFQHAQAEAAARTVSVEQALPFARPKWLYPLVGFVALALFLFLLRFGMERRLDLSMPLLAVLEDPLALAAHEDQAAKAKKNAGKPEAADVISRLGTSTPDALSEQKLSNPPGTAVDSGAQASDPTAPQAAASGKTQEAESNDAGASDPGAAGSPKTGADQPPSSRDGAPQTAQNGSKGQGSPESSGLLSKLRDAMAGLMSKMKPQGNQPPQGGPQNSQQANAKQPNGSQQSGQKSGQDQKSSDGQPQAGEDDSAAAESEQSKSGDGKGKTEQNAAAKPGSGMGHSDGSKDLKDAEQLAAMGKLSEIIGKRSASVTGEMTIEPQSGPQQLRTAYARSNAKHAAASGDVARDEIPVELQAYVQKYFEQVRKQAAKKESHQ
jgi:hypothetical protein